MIKKYLGIAGVVAAVSVSLAACGGAGGTEATTEETTTEAATTSETTTQETTTTAGETTTTTTEMTTAQETTTAAPAETTTGDSDSGSSEEPARIDGYKVNVKKIKDGFTEDGDLSFKKDGAQYSYSVKTGTTSHAVENDLDDMTVKLEDSDAGRLQDVIFAIGKDSNGKTVLRAYKNIGPGGDTAAYACLDYSSDEPFEAGDMAQLLTDGYVTFTAQ